MRRQHEVLLYLRWIGRFSDLKAPVRHDLGFVCRDVEVDEEPCAPHSDKCADKQGEAEQFDGESNPAGASDDAKVEVRFQEVNEDQGRKSVEEPEYTCFKVGEGRVAALDPRWDEDADEQHDEETLRVQLEGCCEVGGDA